MVIYSWDVDDSTPVRLTVHCEYPDQPPTEVTFGLSPSYGLTTGHEANEWFIDMMREYDEFEVETDEDFFYSKCL